MLLYSHIALAVSTAVRYCGTTFAYTAVSVLLNYSEPFLSLQLRDIANSGTVSPPHVVGIANGIAQSIVSLARFFGPIIGGLVSFRPRPKR